MLKYSINSNKVVPKLSSSLASQIYFSMHAPLTFELYWYIIYMYVHMCTMHIQRILIYILLTVSIAGL